MYTIETNRSPWRTARKVFISLACLAAAFYAGTYVSNQGGIKQTIGVFEGKVLNKPSSSPDVDFKLFWEVWNTLKRDYVDQDKLTEKKLFYGALQGLVDATDDPYSVFMNPEEARSFEDDLSGTFDGIGAEIGFRDKILTVIAPLEDAPAIKAGLLAGDQIYEIDGKSAADLSLEEAVKKIRGVKGTSVVLKIGREKESRPIDITVVRDTVIVKSVKNSFDEKNGIMTIKISNFNSDTENLFNKAVQETQLKKAKGVILDLRNNPGGYLETAVIVASEWVKEGTIVSEQFGDSRKIEHMSKGTGRLSDIPTVVLVNGGSASASEIVAGALKDMGKGFLIGQKTFGKGSVQILRQLEDGSVIKITTAKWLTPKGNNINDQGIEPDKVVERTDKEREEKKDSQNDAAIEQLTNTGQ